MKTENIEGEEGLMPVKRLEAFEDNYIWVVEVGDQALVVDPGQADPVLDYLETSGKKLAAILLTHDHQDHVAGVDQLIEENPNTPVYGPQETGSYNSQTVQDGDQFTLLGDSFTVYLTAGHTPGHISYLSGERLFCGDALFSGGCGRVFTGDYQAQFDALQLFKTMEDSVQVYAGHEYTESNLAFAHSVQADNSVISKALEEVREKRARGEATLPSSLAFEKQVNVFLQAEDLETFKNLREKKDQF